MPTTKTYDADDNIKEYLEEPLKATIYYEDARTEYGSGIKAGVHLQSATANPDDIAHAFGVAKAQVDLALADAPRPEAKAVTPKASGGGFKKAAPKAAGNVDKDAAWQDVIHNRDGWFDNRSDKRNPKAPDYKGKDKNTAFAGVGLWLDSAPEGFDPEAF